MNKAALKGFWSNVIKGKSQEACWKWIGVKDRNGYARFNIGGIPKLAHRISLEIKLKRRLLPGECSLHKCDNPECINPFHLFSGTVADNNHDMMKKGRFRHHGGISGEANGFSKLTADIIKEIRRLYVSGECRNFSEIARRFHLHHSTVRAIVIRKAWRHIK